MSTRKSMAAAALAAATLVATDIGPAFAADLGGAPRRPRDVPVYEPLQIERWTGFYFGGTLGYGWGEGRATGAVGAIPFDQDGITGTILAGYNWQIGSAVLGVETDVGTGDMSARTSTAFGTLEHDLSWYGSFRGRAGFLVSPAMLLYGTAGLAWANMDVGFANASKTSETFWGYQLGAGAEWMMSRNLTLRLEYIYTDLDSQRVTHSGLTSTYEPDFHTVRAGISFKF